jgi:hypothetical protein
VFKLRGESFSSDTKFDSGTDGPVSTNPPDDNVEYVEDNTHGRTEAVCKRCRPIWAMCLMTDHSYGQALLHQLLFAETEKGLNLAK